MTTTLLTKKPEDRLDYDVKFNRWLTPEDVIVSAEVTISEGGVEIAEYEISDQKVKVWLSGGEIGETATITVVAFTEQNREKEVCFRVRVRGCCS